MMCKRGCLEKLAKEQEAKIEAVRVALNERATLLVNLKATQERCTELLDESRAKSRRIQELEEEVKTLRQTLEAKDVT